MGGGDAASERTQLAELFRRDYDSLVRLARLLGEPADAEDLVQSAFVRAFGRARLRDRQQGSAYLRRTVVNLTRSAWRRRAVARRYRWLHPREEMPATDLAGGVAVRQALARLPQRQREAVVLRYYADLSESATAELMGVSIGSVKAYTSRGLARLAQELMRNQK